MMNAFAAAGRSIRIAAESNRKVRKERAPFYYFTKGTFTVTGGDPRMRGEGPFCGERKR
jgi:hypothetical protein